MVTHPRMDANVSIAVVVQINTQRQSQADRDLNRDLIRVAVAELHAQGAMVTIHDVDADRQPDFGEIAASDGVLVLGGGDVDATVYGYTGDVANGYGTDRRADEREIAIIRRGIQDDAIMLHICRGSQLLNVACGGSLIPDIQPHTLHRGGRGQPLFIDEYVTIAPGTLLHALYGDRLRVRSGHHQAVDRPGNGLRVVATADDGIVEATERIDNTWITGIQWHPEERDANPADRRILFGEFLRQVRLRASETAKVVGQ